MTDSINRENITNRGANALANKPTSLVSDKLPFEKPKLSFTRPQLIKHGDVTALTAIGGGFFGTFSP
jgi:hypothetical protein